MWSVNITHGEVLRRERIPLRSDAETSHLSGEEASNNSCQIIHKVLQLSFLGMFVSSGSVM